MTTTPHTAEALAAQLDRPHWTGLPIELHVEAAAILRQQAQEIERLHALITKIHTAKGRYHTQIACCDLFDALHLPNERPVSLRPAMKDHK